MNLKTISIILGMFILLNSIAFSQCKIYTFEELVNTSNLIVRGKVEAIHTYEMREGFLFSDIVFQVTDIYKGNEKIGNNLIFRLIGGTKNGITTIITENPQFEQNQESILFLKTKNTINSNQKYIVNGLSQGKFNISIDKGTEIVERDERESNKLFFFQKNVEKIVTNKKSIKLAEFANYIREKSK